MNLPAYCTNVEPADTLADVEAHLDRVAAPVAAALGADPLPIALHLAEPVARALDADPAQAQRFGDGLRERGLSVGSMNAYPYRGFHGDCVKEAVFRPTWEEPDRAAYTLACARLLASWLPEGGSGAVSSVFGGPRGTDAGAVAEAVAATGLALGRIRAETGRDVVLALEPEPSTMVENAAEAAAFLEPIAEALGADRDLVGACVDAAHHAVVWDDPVEVAAVYAAAGVVVGKVQASCALEADPADAAALAPLCKSPWLHQVRAQVPGGGLIGVDDLPELMERDTTRPWRDAPAWRIHCHVPVGRDPDGPLRATRGALEATLGAVACPVIEVETYTWSVLPPSLRGDDLVEEIAEEIRWTSGALQRAESGRAAS